MFASFAKFFMVKVEGRKMMDKTFFQKLLIQVDHCEPT